MKISKAGIITIVTLSLLFMGSVLLLYVNGFRFLNIVSPSMGETAPVGTLIVTKPADSYQNNDIISFYRGGQIYTHRLVKVEPDGSFITKGDLNIAEDAQPVKPSDVVGKAVVIAPVWSWVWRALPFILIGAVIVYLISCIRLLRDRWRWPVRIIGMSMVVIITTIILNPWLRVDTLSITAHTDRDIKLHIVNTGIFPIRGDDGQRIHTGQATFVSVTDKDEHGRYVYIPRPSLGPIGVILALLWCLMPLIVALLIKLPPPEEELTGLQLSRERRRNMALLIAVITVEVVLLTIQLSSLAAFTAEVRNTANTTPTNYYFRCHNYASATNPRPYLAYGLNTLSTLRTDLSGNSRYGTNFGMFSNTLSNVNACVRDSTVSSGNNTNDRATTFSESAQTCIINDGTTNIPGATPTTTPTWIIAPTNLTLSVWFKTDNKNMNGKIIGFGQAFTNDSSQTDGNDRNLYIDKDGRVVFGTYPGTLRYIASPAGRNYADNQWHHVAVSLSTTDGSKMYIDGNKVAEDSTMTSAQNLAGYWKIGCGKLAWWKNGDGSYFNGKYFFTGQMRFMAVYHTALTEEQMKSHYLAGK